MAQRIAIVDSGGANIASLLYALRRLQTEAILTTDADTIKSAERVILPGVGAAKDAMQRLRENDLVDVIRELTQPVLGICLGMQLLADASEEEDVDCLGIIPGVAAKLPADSNYPVPNMGWCPINKRCNHELLYTAMRYRYRHLRWRMQSMLSHFQRLSVATTLLPLSFIPNDPRPQVPVYWKAF
jgi:glutamine amidotransferase